MKRRTVETTVMIRIDVRNSASANAGLGLVSIIRTGIHTVQPAVAIGIKRNSVDIII